MILADVLAANTKEGELWEPIDGNRIHCYASGHEYPLPADQIYCQRVARDPRHVTAVHPTYRMTDRDGTSRQTLTRATSIGLPSGLQYVYAGNRSGEVGALENTHCANCQTRVTEGFGYNMRSYRLTADGQCPSCETLVPGRWDPIFAASSLPPSLCRSGPV